MQLTFLVSCDFRASFAFTVTNKTWQLLINTDFQSLFLVVMTYNIDDKSKSTNGLLQMLHSDWLGYYGQLVKALGGETEG